MVQAGSSTTYLEQLDESRPRYSCNSCTADLALADELVSKSFSSAQGAAYLFRSTCNVVKGPETKRELLTGTHIIANLACLGCGQNLGWTYIKAFDASQTYKTGKFILELDKIHKTSGWTIGNE